MTVPKTFSGEPWLSPETFAAVKARRRLDARAAMWLLPKIAAIRTCVARLM